MQIVSPEEAGRIPLWVLHTIHLQHILDKVVDTLFSSYFGHYMCYIAWLLFWIIVPQRCFIYIFFLGVRARTNTLAYLVYF